MNKSINEKYLEKTIDWYRQLFTLFSAISIACIAWLVSNYNESILQLIILDGIAIITAFFAISVVVIKIRKYLKKFRNIFWFRDFWV